MNARRPQVVMMNPSRFVVRAGLALTILLMGVGGAWSALSGSPKPSPVALAQATGPPPTAEVVGAVCCEAPTSHPAAESLATPDPGEPSQGLPAGEWALAEPAGENRPIVAYGRADYDQTRLVQLSSRVNGVVWQVQRRLGEFVRAGDVVAIIESNEVGQAKAALLSTLATHHLQTKLVERLRTLDPLVLSAKQLELAEAELKGVRVEVFTAQQALLNLGLTVDLEALMAAAEDEALGQLRFLGLDPAIVAKLDPKRTTANLLPLVAPSDGVVIGAEMVRGEVVGRGVPLVTIADVRHMWIRLDVQADQAGGLELGQRITFLPDDQSAPVESEISWISTEVDTRTRTVEVRANLVRPLPEQGPEGLLISGLRAYTYGRGLIHPRQDKTVVQIPTRAVRWNGSKHTVLVARPDQGIELRAVSLARVDETTTEVQAGIRPGERVLVAGGHWNDDPLEPIQRLADSMLPAKH